MSESFRWDRFELRPSERVLRADGQPVPLGSRAFDLLLCLVAHRDRVLSKSEVLAQVWPGQVVEENNLSVHVSALRKVLGATAIATVSGRGYRFTPALEAAGAPEPARPDRPSIAVLPLNVLSDDSRIAYFALGLVEDVIALLARVPGFELVAHASSSQFRGPQPDAHEVARQLGVRFLVQGSVQPRGEVLRVSLQLVDAATARILWSARFDSADGDAVDAQESIARGIIRELEPELTLAQMDHVRRQRPGNLDAWSHYHAAAGALVARGWSTDGLATARAELRRSLALDPRFGLGQAQYALLTILEANIGIADDTPALRTEVLAAADAAVALDDGSSEVLGYAGCALCDLGRFEVGLPILQRALALNPSNAQAHVALGAAMALNGQLEKGIRRLREGMRISPRDRRLGFWGWLLGCFLLRAERIDEALAAATAACQADQRFHLAHILAAACHDRLDARDQAVLALAQARRCRPGLTPDEVAKTHGRRIAARLGQLWAEAAP